MYTGKKLDSNKSKTKINKYGQEILRLRKKCQNYKLMIRRLKKNFDK